MEQNNLNQPQAQMQPNQPNVNIAEQLHHRIVQLEQALAAAHQLAPQAAPVLEHPANRMSSSLKPNPPASFSGALGANPDQWLREVERYLRVVGADQSKWVPFACTFLKAGAGTWFNNLEQQHPQQVHNWSFFTQQFRSRFSPFEAARMARASLRTLQQRGRVASYIEAFLKQVELIPDMALADQLDAFIHGLHPRLADVVDKERPESLMEAMNAAQREEIRQATRNRHHGSSHTVPFTYRRALPQHAADGDHMDLSVLDQQLEELYAIPALDSSTEIASAPTSMLAAMYQGPSRRGPPRSQYSGVPNLSREEYDRLSVERRCFNCQGTGHMARNCSKPRRSGSKPNGGASSSSSGQPSK